MATQEARAMLAELMGADRNAPLPRGMALPTSRRNKKRREEEYLRHASAHKRTKSCYDPDVDPLYTAWGVDVYELFVNTKSDLGANPYVVDAAARDEYLKLPAPEKEKLGYDYFLFQKLSELVRSADRTVARNEEKLKVELQRKRSMGRAENLFVEEVDDSALEGLCRSLVQVELLEEEMGDKLGQLGELTEQEASRKSELEGLLERKKMQSQEEAKAKAETAEAEAEAKAEGSAGANEEEKEEEDTKHETTKEEAEAQGKQEKAGGADADASEPAAPAEEREGLGGGDTTEDGGSAEVASAAAAPAASAATIAKAESVAVAAAAPLTDEEEERLQALQVELGRFTLDRQLLLHRIAAIVRQLVPIHEGMQQQRRHLLTVRNDITTDKTVCHVSGNFLSARDADERIAAHYAGKQYQGWRLVRDKLKELQRTYGRYGPPPPAGGANRGAGGPGAGGGLSVGGGRGGPPQPHRRGSSSGPPPPRGGGGYGGRSGGVGGGGPPRRYDDGYGGGGYGGGGPPPPSSYPRGGGGGGGGPDRSAGGGRWERHGPQPPPPHQSSYGSRGGGGGGGGPWRR